jgi:hypothetical protein
MGLILGRAAPSVYAYSPKNGANGRNRSSGHNRRNSRRSPREEGRGNGT